MFDQTKTKKTMLDHRKHHWMKRVKNIFDFGELFQDDVRAALGQSISMIGQLVFASKKILSSFGP